MAAAAWTPVDENAAAWTPVDEERKPTASIRPVDTGVKHWLEGVESDVRTGGTTTWPGRALHFLGARGTESGAGGGEHGVGEFIGGPVIGPAVAAHGLATIPEDPVKGINETLRGVAQTAAPIVGATIPAAIPSAVAYGGLGKGTEKVASALGADPDTAELAGNVTAFAAPGAIPRTGRLLERYKEPIGKAAGYGTALYETARTKNPLWLLSGAGTRLATETTGRLGRGMQSAQFDLGIPGTPAAEPTFPGAPYPEHPGTFPGAPLPATPAPEQLNPSLVSPARSLPGQVGAERIYPQRATPAEPIPPRTGLQLTGDVGHPTASWNVDQLRAPLTTERAMAARTAETPATSPRELQNQLETSLGATKPQIKPGVPIRQQATAPQTEASALPEGHEPVKSSALKSWKYDPQTREFESVTKSGQHYIHGDVSPEEAAAFEKAESKGRAWQAIRNNPLVAKVVNGERVPVKASMAKAGLEEENAPTSAKPLAFRSRNLGEEGVPYHPESHAQATMSAEEAHNRIRPSKEDAFGPQEVVGVDLGKVPGFSTKAGPRGADWVKFHGDVPEAAISRHDLRGDLTGVLKESVKRAKRKAKASE